MQHNVIIAGDYNINLLKLNENEVIGNFFDLLTSHSIYPQTILESTAGILIKQFSVHQPYFIFMDTAYKKQSNLKTTKIHMETNEALLRIKHDIHMSDIYSKLDTSHNADKMLHQIIETTKHNHIPIKVKFHKCRHKKSNWITKGLLRSIKYRDKRYKQLKMSHADSAEHNTCYINLKTYNAANIGKTINEIIS